MTETINKLEQLLENGLGYLTQTSKLQLSRKKITKKQSKKQILKHLIDSGINNLKRFTDIKFESKPYLIRN